MSLRRVLAGAFLVATLAAAAGPHARWLQSEAAFGVINESDKPAWIELQAVNDGDAPLVVVNARANCGCTKPRYNSRPVAPGDTLTIALGYYSEGRPGKINKKLYVTLNDSDKPREFDVTGTVIGSPTTLAERYPISFAEGRVRLRQADFMFGNVKKTGVVGSYIEGYNATADTLTLRLGDLPKALSATLSGPDVAPGEQFIVSATYAGAEAGGWDMQSDTLMLYAGDIAVPIGATAIVLEDFSRVNPAAPAPRISVDPRMITFEEPMTVDGAPRSVALTITNQGKAPLNIRRIYSPSEAISVEGTIKGAIKPGKKAKVEVKINPTQLSGKEILDERLLVITDDPVSPRTIIRVTAPLK